MSRILSCKQLAVSMQRAKNEMRPKKGYQSRLQFISRAVINWQR